MFVDAPSASCTVLVSERIAILKRWAYRAVAVLTKDISDPESMSAVSCSRTVMCGRGWYLTRKFVGTERERPLRRPDPRIPRDDSRGSRRHPCHSVNKISWAVACSLSECVLAACSANNTPLGCKRRQRLRDRRACVRAFVRGAASRSARTRRRVRLTPPDR